MLPHLLLHVGLILLNSIIAFAESAAVAINDSKLAALAAKGDRRAIRLTKLTNRPAEFFKKIRISIAFISFLAVTFATDYFLDPWVWIDLCAKFDFTLPLDVAKIISIFVIAIVLAYFHLVFGELVPKRLGEKNPEKSALRCSLFLAFIAGIVTPFACIVSVSANLVIRIFGIDPHAHNEEVTEEEIKMMVDEGTEKGTIDEEEKEIIQNVFEFDSLSAEEVATHRTDISFLWIDDDIEEWEKTISETSFTRYPICSENVDKIIGILNVRKFYNLEDKSRESVMANAVKPAYFVPESVKADVLFKNMKERKEAMAVVIDEYGGTSGIVTLNDLIARLVGEFNIEIDSEEDTSPEIQQIDEALWRVKGTAATEDVADALGVPTDSGESDTISGYALGLYGSIPEDGTTFEVETSEMTIKALEIKEHTVEKLEIYVKPPVAEEEKDSESEDSSDKKNTVSEE